MSHLVPLLPLLADDVGVVVVGVVAGAATVGVVGVATVCVCSCVVFFLLLLGRMAWMTHTHKHTRRWEFHTMFWVEWNEDCLVGWFFGIFVWWAHGRNQPKLQPEHRMPIENR